jgi:hypothetical protein
MQPFGYEPYGPPETSARRPGVILWYRVYAATMIALYVGAGAFWHFLAPQGPSAAAGLVTTIVLLLIIAALGALFVIAALVPYKPWGWTFGLIAICIGLSGCTAAIAIPLLIYWMKPEVKAAFCRL